MSQKNVEVAKAFYDAYNARNSEALDRLLHPEAEITTLSARGGLGGDWSRATTRQYFEQLDEAWTGLRIEVENYREVGERVVALGVARGAGMSSHVEVVSDFAAVLVVRDSQIVLVDSYSNWKDALEAVGLRSSQARLLRRGDSSPTDTRWAEPRLLERLRSTPGGRRVQVSVRGRFGEP